MEIEKRKQQIKSWMDEGYKFYCDRKDGPLMALEGQRPVPISIQTYYFANRVMNQGRA